MWCCLWSCEVVSMMVSGMVLSLAVYGVMMVVVCRVVRPSACLVHVLLVYHVLVKY